MLCACETNLLVITQGQEIVRVRCIILFSTNQPILKSFCFYEKKSHFSFRVVPFPSILSLSPPLSVSLSVFSLSLFYTHTHTHTHTLFLFTLASLYTLIGKGLFYNIRQNIASYYFPHVAQVSSKNTFFSFLAMVTLQERKHNTSGPHQVLRESFMSNEVLRVLQFPPSSLIYYSTVWSLEQRGQINYQSLSHVRLFGTPRNVAHQDPFSMGFSRQEYWSGLLFSSPKHLPYPGIKLRGTCIAGRFFTD